MRTTKPELQRLKPHGFCKRYVVAEATTCRDSQVATHGLHQGMIFFNPFFFLLVDSELVSTGVGFTVVEALSADCAAGWAELVPEAGAGVVLSAVVPEAPEALELEGLAESAGVFAVPEPFRPASTVPLVAGGGASGATAGVAVAGCSDVGWPLSSSGVRICAPTVAPDVSAPAGAVVASSGVTTSLPTPEVCALEPAAPGRRTSVAETASLGGAICGVPPRAALEVSGFPLSMPIGSLSTTLW